MPQAFAHNIDYDLMVNWPKRLAREVPFFLDLFRGHGVRRVIDVACGTGHHAAAFAAEGFDVVAADVSEDMIAVARSNFPDTPVDFRVLDMTRLDDTFAPASFDACVSLGNSFPCLESAADIDRALSGFARILRPGGVLVIHMLNFTRLTGARTFRGPHPGSDPTRDILFLKILDPRSDKIQITILQLEHADSWQLRSQTGSLTPILPDQLTQAARRAGFKELALFGAHDQSPFHPKESDSFIVVAYNEGSRG